MTDSRRGGPAEGIDALLETLLQQKGLTPQLQRYKAWLCWDVVVGPQIARHARPLRLRDTLLEVRVDQAVWMQQLQLLKPMIVKKLNQHLGNDVISDLFLKRGPVPPQPPAPEPELPLPQLNSNEQSRVDRLAAAIPDLELRHQLTQLIAKDLRQKKRRTPI